MLMKNGVLAPSSSFFEYSNRYDIISPKLMKTQNFEPFIRIEIHSSSLTQVTLDDPERKQASCDQNR